MKKKIKLYIILAILGVILVVGGTSYAILTLLLEGTVENVLAAGNLSLTLSESNSITLDNAIPTSDEEGLLTDSFNFTVENDGTIESGYKIYLDDQPIGVGENRIDSSNIRYELKVDGAQDTISNLSSDSTELYISNIKPGVVVNFELRIWVDYDVTSILPNTVHISRLRIEASQNLNILPLDPNAPELVGDMIPVVYDETQDEWLKVDTSTEWYNYDEQEWANAVTVTETNRATLVDSNPGTVIPMEDINAMFVWIPRYSYTIGNTYGYQGYGGSIPSVDTPGAFDIKWIDSNTTELGTASYTGDTASEWYTNPAFCWGNSCDDPATRSNSENRELSGIWVGKFETSTIGGVETNAVQQTTIKPNVISWRNVNISNMFKSVQTYMNSASGESIFGLSGSTYDTHMMKNTEWGTVVYLSQSKYGKYGNTLYTGANKEIAINNCSSFITGISGNTVNASHISSTCTTNMYETEKGQAASTTGNITGVYDMSGGANEYVMGNMKDATGIFNSQASGFITAPVSRYYNSYLYGGDSDDLIRSMLGDGTKETAGFYGDFKSFVAEDYCWFLRGGNIINAGAFYFASWDGNVASDGGFRITLSP